MDSQEPSEEKKIANALINSDTIPLDLQPPSSPSVSSPMTSTRSNLETLSPLNTNTSLNPRQKRASLACIRCRTRHIRCPGGDPCRKCQLAKSKCEYVEADKKIVVSMKYLSKLHDEIARLKKDNAGLRNNLKEQELKRVDAQQEDPNLQIQHQPTEFLPYPWLRM